MAVAAATGYCSRGTVAAGTVAVGSTVPGKVPGGVLHSERRVGILISRRRSVLGGNVLRVGLMGKAGQDSVGRIPWRGFIDGRHPVRSLHSRRRTGPRRDGRGRRRHLAHRGERA